MPPVKKSDGVLNAYLIFFLIDPFDHFFCNTICILSVALQTVLAHQQKKPPPGQEAAMAVTP